MRVIHVAKYYPPYAGGMENFLRDLLHALERSGVQTAALVHNHQPGWGAVETRNQGSLVLRVPSYGTLLYAPFSPSFPFALKKMIRRFCPHILHLHMPNTSAFWALAVPEARRIPWVVHWHADVVPSAIDRRLKAAYRFYRPLEHWMLRRTEAVIATSPPYLESSEALKPWRTKCHVVPLGLDPERLPQPTPSALDKAQSIWGSSPFRVLSIGRLTYYKGHDVLIRALRHVPEARAAIVGTGPMEKSLRWIAETSGVASRVHFAGRLPDEALQALTVTCHVLCLPSKERTEAFGLVLLEAMRYEKPIVASDVEGSGMGWVVRHGETGFMAPHGDAEKLAEILGRLSKDPGLAKIMGQRGGERFRDLFHIHRVARGVLKVYEDVLKVHPVPVFPKESLCTLRHIDPQNPDSSRLARPAL